MAAQPEVITKYDHAKLVGLWEDIQAGRKTAFASGKAFEHTILRAFELEGADVTWPYDVPGIEARVVEQIDGAVHAGRLSCLVEAKDWARNADVEPIAKLAMRLGRRPNPAVGLVFGRLGFTRAAVESSRYLLPQSVLLWEGAEFDLALRKKRMLDALELKYRMAVEIGWPNYNIGAAGW